MGKSKLVISTGNKHKVEEIKEILKDLDIEILSKSDVLKEELEVVEDGDTLEANSIKKAKALSEKVDFMILADDSGLFVNSLNGEPGVYSSRYAGEEGNDKKNYVKLLDNLKDIKDRSGCFKTVIALITEDKKIHTVEGTCNGTIGFEPRGDNGFGYDPIFIPDGYDLTFSELGEDVKNKISHRALALNELKILLKNLLEGDNNADSCS